MTVKQMGIIYRAFKEGRLEKTTAEDINNAYTLVKKLNNPVLSYELKAHHHSAYQNTIGLEKAVDAVLAGDYEKADSIVCGFASVRDY